MNATLSLDAARPAPSSPDGGESPRAALCRRLGSLRGIVVLCAFGIAPLLLAFFGDLWVRPQYQFFPLALVGAGLLARQRLAQLTEPPAPGRTAIASLWLLAAFVLFVFGVLIWFPLVGGVAVWMLLAGLVWLIGGARLFATLAPTFLLFLAITPPLGLESPFLRLLRRLAVVGSSRLLDHAGVIHAVEGNILHLPGKTLLVEEACSGINSVLLGLTLCIFHHCWRRRPVPWLLVTLPATIAFVLVGNMFRIVLGAVLQYHAGIAVLHGWRHEVIGLVLLAGYVGLILSQDRLLEFLLHRSPEQALDDADPPAPSPARRALPATTHGFRTPAWAWGIAAGFALAGVFSLGRLATQPELRQTIAATPSKAGFATASALELPPTLAGWERIETRDAVNQSVEISGVSSRIWYYRLGDLQATVALDYPLRGYHDAKICYTSQGWNLAGENLATTDASAGVRVYTQARFQRSPLLFAQVCHGVVGLDGRWLEPPSAGVGAALGNRLRTMARGYAPTLRLQTLAVGHSEIGTDDAARVDALFLAASQVLTRHLATAGRGHPGT